jgi:hypothetical protein
MSLLARGTETVTVFPEEQTTDRDGNKITRPSAVGVVCRAVVQPISSPTEDMEIGFLTEAKYRLRLVGYPALLDAHAQVEWQGKRFSIDGEPQRYNGSRRTAHCDYTIVRK